MGEPVITLDRISKTFKDTAVLSNVAATFHSGSVSAIVGGNGSGKSVLFKIICGFIRPTSGSVRMPEHIRRQRDDYPFNMGILIEGPGYIPSATGLENLMELARINRRASLEDITRYAEMLGLAPHLHKKVRHYSVGTKQKLGLVQAVMEEPAVLLLDEPFNGLDIEATTALRKLLRDWVTEDRAVVLTSHIPGTISDVATSTWALDAGVLRPQHG